MLRSMKCDTTRVSYQHNFESLRSLPSFRHFCHFLLSYELCERFVSLLPAMHCASNAALTPSLSNRTLLGMELKEMWLLSYMCGCMFTCDWKTAKRLIDPRTYGCMSSEGYGFYHRETWRCIHTLYSSDGYKYYLVGIFRVIKATTITRRLLLDVKKKFKTWNFHKVPRWVVSSN